MAAGCYVCAQHQALSVIPGKDDFRLGCPGRFSSEPFTGVSTADGMTWNVSLDPYTAGPANYVCGFGNVRMQFVDDDSVVDSAGNPVGGPGAGNGSLES